MIGFMLVHIAAWTSSRSPSLTGLFLELRKPLACIASIDATLLGEKKQKEKEALRLRSLSGNLPDAVMVHNDVALPSRYTVHRTSCGTCHPMDLFTAYIICFAVS